MTRAPYNQEVGRVRTQARIALTSCLDSMDSIAVQCLAFAPCGAFSIEHLLLVGQQDVQEMLA